MPRSSSRSLPGSLARRPLLVGAATLAAVSLGGAGWAVTAAPTDVLPLSAAQQRAVTHQAEAAQADREFQQAAARTAAAERAAQIAAKEAAEKAAAEEAARLEAERVAEAERAAAAERASRAAARDPRGAARAMLGDHGWGDGEFGCLDTLWQRESNWKTTADNPTSSAYGIPQALPGSKMASAGADWQTNPVTQIRWGLGYIDEVYGSPCAALEHSNAHNWY